MKKLSLPLFMHSIAAGFPSPADDYLENTLDLNTHLIKHPAANPLKNYLFLCYSAWLRSL